MKNIILVLSLLLLSACAPDGTLEQPSHPFTEPELQGAWVSYRMVCKVGFSNEDVFDIPEDQSIYLAIKQQSYVIYTYSLTEEVFTYSENGSMVDLQKHYDDLEPIENNEAVGTKRQDDKVCKTFFKNTPDKI